MKFFHTQDVCYTFSAFVLEKIPLLPATVEVSDRGELLAAGLMEDACYLSAEGGDQAAIELTRVAGKQSGGAICHILALRCRDAAKHSCRIRHEAWVQGMGRAMHRSGYQLREIDFEEYLAATKASPGEAVWSLGKTPLRERGIQGTYVSLPVIGDVDWQGIYSALDGSGCRFSLGVIPALATDAQRGVIGQYYAKSCQAAEGMVSGLRDPVAEDARQRWKLLAEQMNRPLANVHITVQGEKAEAALVCARLRQAVPGSCFRVAEVAGYEKLTLFDLPWQLCAREAAELPITGWTCAEAAKLLAFPQQGEYFTGVAGNPLSLLPEGELLPAALTARGRGRIDLGTSCGSGQPVSLPLHAFLLHTGVFGKSGVGKTTLLKQLIRSFEKENIPVLILEPVKREYRSLVAEGSKAKVFTVESPATPLLLNPFRVPTGVKLGDYRSSLLSAFKAAFSLPDPLPALFEKAISESYRQYGWTDQSYSTDADVTVFDMAQFIRVFHRVIRTSSYSGEVKGNMMAGGGFRLQSLLERCPRTFDTLHSTEVTELLEGTVILEMGNLEPEQKSLVSSLTLIAILAWLKATRASGNSLRNMIFIDEAHALLDQGEGTTLEEKALNSTMNQLLVNLVTEIRAYGVGILFSDQSPSRIGQKLLDNVDNVIAFRLSGKEAQMLCTHIGGTEALAQGIPLLETGELVLWNHLLRRPVAVKAAAPARGAGVVSDDALVQRQKGYLSAHARQYCPYRQCQAAGCSGCSFTVREEAGKCAAQIYVARQGRLKEPEGLAAHLLRLPAALAGQDYDPGSGNFDKLCVCTAVQLIRRCALEGGLLLTENAENRLLGQLPRQERKESHGNGMGQ